MMLLGILIAIAAPISLSMVLGDGLTSNAASPTGAGHGDTGGVIAEDDYDGVDINDDTPDLLDFIDGDAPAVGQDEDVTLTGFSDDFTGDSTDQTIDGGSGLDIIDGAGGSDVIIGGEGSDVVAGGSGGDSITGGNGGEVVLGESGNDTISGDAGFDFIHGGSGDDLIDGGVGNDTLLSGTGQDTLLGGEGDDLLSGIRYLDDDLTLEDVTVVEFDGTALSAEEDDGDRDFLFGGEGNDEIDLGAGDVGNGGEGDDIFSVLGDGYRNAGSDVSVIADFEPGQDSLQVIVPQNEGLPDITLQASGNDLIVRGNGLALALLKGVSAAEFSVDDVEFVEIIFTE